MIDWNAMDIGEMAEELGRGLQCLEGRLQDVPTKVATIRFPRSVIRPSGYYVRNHLAFLPNDVTRRNIAYTLQATDVNRWLVNRFDLGLSARSIFYKQACVTMVSAMEAVLGAVWCHRHEDRRRPKSFAVVIDALADEGLISSETARLLHEARNVRNNIHVHRVPQLEWNRYSTGVYNSIVRTEHRVFEELREAARRSG